MNETDRSAETISIAVKVPSRREFVDEYVAGCAGGIAGLLIGHPLDTVKVILQTQQTAVEFRSLRHCLSVVSSYSINRGFFRGLSAPLISQAAANAVYFGTFFNCKHYLLPRFVQSQNIRDYLAGCIAGCSMLIIAVPVDVVKITMQSQVGRKNTSRMYTSALVCMVDLLRRGGLQAAYRGLAVQTLLWVPSSGLYFWLYETFKPYAYRRFGEQSYAASLLAGGAAGTLSWLSVAPLDVLKSRMQADPTGVHYHSLRQCFRVTWSVGGMRGLFRGTSVLLLRAFPVNALTFATYEYTIEILKNARTTV